MTTRLITKKEAMQRLGVLTYSTFNELMKKENAPKPVIQKSKWSLWDFSAIEQFLDKMSNINKQSKDWDAELEERLSKRGKNRG